jgi:hypothetical protein
MAEDKDLVHILRLLDDESPKVRDHVWEKVASNLPAWEAGIRARLDDMPGELRRKLTELLSGNARKGFRNNWLRWRELPSDMDKLEAALSGLSWFLAGERARKDGDGSAGENGGFGNLEVTHESGPRHPGLAAMLDGLASDFRLSGEPMRPTALARFLFIQKGFKGAEQDYYNPGNSDLVHVIEKGQGIPISLACIYMLVGHRLGFEISGCDVPEHFLTRALEEGQDVIIDCFDGGKVLDADRLSQLERKYAPEFNRLLRAAAQPEAIVARVLRNLINAYHLAGERRASQFMWSLAEDLRGERGEDPDPAEGPEPE